jgi:hypothetical protein
MRIRPSHNPGKSDGNRARRTPAEEQTLFWQARAPFRLCCGQADVYFFSKLYNPSNRQLVAVTLEEAPKSAFTKVGLAKKK